MNKYVLIFAIIVIFYSFFIFFNSFDYETFNNGLNDHENENNTINYEIVPISDSERCSLIMLDVYNETACIRYLDEI